MTQPIVQLIALDMASGDTAVMHFVTKAKDRDCPATSENVEAEIAKAGHNVSGWRFIDEAEYALIRASRPRPEPKAWAQEPFTHSPPPITLSPPLQTIDSERDRRIAKGFKFEGSLYSATPDDYSRIASYVAQATAAVAMGVQAGNLFWHGGDDEFTWTDMNGIPVPLDAQQMIALGRAANAHRMRLDKKANELKNRPGGPPPDITDDEYWT